MPTRNNPVIRSALSESAFFQRLKAKPKKVEVDETEYYILEGDTLLTEDQLLFYAQQQEAIAQARAAQRAAEGEGIRLIGTLHSPSSELIGIVEQGKLVRWRPGLTLTYCVLKRTFSDLANYELICDNMERASASWEKTCGIQFDHNRSEDDIDTLQPRSVLFTVREFNARGRFIAAAFFPDDPINRRRVLIDPSYYSVELRFDKVGVLRHELGHVLGFRHEHINSLAPPGCPDEDIFGKIELTDYDPKSVMHYFCGGVGSEGLEITEVDKRGAQKVYGPPLATFHFVE
jgi:matrixin